MQEKSYCKKTVEYRYISECYPRYFYTRRRGGGVRGVGRGAWGCLPLHVSGRRGEGEATAAPPSLPGAPD